MATPLKLPAIRASPTTLQYAAKPRLPHVRPPYPRKFYPNEAVKATLAEPWLAETDPLMPPYPYGRNHTFDEANYGLYGGQTIQSGNKIAKGRNKGKTLRKWYPNVRQEKFQSLALGKELNLAVTSRCLRTINKAGGLDQYVLGEKPARIKELGLLGWKLRWLVLRSHTVRERYAKERERLGLPSSERNMYSADVTFEEAWKDETVREEILEKMIQNWQALVETNAVMRKHFTETLKYHAFDRKWLRMPKQLELFDPAKLKSALPVEVVEEPIPLVERFKFPKKDTKRMRWDAIVNKYGPDSGKQVGEAKQQSITTT